MCAQLTSQAVYLSCDAVQQCTALYRFLLYRLCDVHNRLSCCTEPIRPRHLSGIPVSSLSAKIVCHRWHAPPRYISEQNSRWLFETSAVGQIWENSDHGSGNAEIPPQVRVKGFSSVLWSTTTNYHAAEVTCTATPGKRSRLNDQ